MGVHWSGERSTFDGYIDDIDSDLYSIWKEEFVAGPNDTTNCAKLEHARGIFNNIEDQDSQIVDSEALGTMRELVECLNGPKFDPKTLSRADPVIGRITELVCETTAFWVCSGNKDAS